MGDTIPEWALTRAREVIASRRKHESMAVAIARDLAAVEAETAERVERETRGADAARLQELAAGRRAWKGKPDSRIAMMTRDDLQEDCAQTLEIGARAIRALPAKHGKATT